MHNTKLIKLLKCLSSAELKHFLRYVSTPYFNQNQKLILLAREIIKAAPDFNSSRLNKKSLFLSLFGKDETFSSQKIHDQMSLLTRLLEKFLTQLRFEQEEQEQNYLLIKELQSRKMYRYSGKIHQQATKSLQQATLKDANYYFQQYRLIGMEEVQPDRNNAKAFNHNFSQSLFHLKIYYLASTLQQICVWLNRKEIIQLDFNQCIIDEIKSMIAHNREEILRVPVVAIYYHILLLLTEPEADNAYYKLVQLLKTYASHFSKEEAYAMYAFLQNYCIKQINKGNSQFRDELFQLYQRLLSEKLLMISGHLQHEHYKNITYLGLLLRKYEWVRDFLDEYKIYLYPEIRENAYTYNLATYYYESGQYKSAMKLLQQVTFTDVYYDLSARSMLLRIFYEMRDDESLKYIFPAFLAFLKRNKRISAIHIERHKNLIRFARKANRIRKRIENTPPDLLKNQIEKLKEEIAATQKVANINWLKEELHKLDTERIQYYQSIVQWA